MQNNKWRHVCLAKSRWCICVSNDSPANDAFGEHRIRCRCHSPAFRRLETQLARKFSRRAFLGGSAAVIVESAFWPKAASAKTPDPPSSPVAFTNIQLFDGKSDALHKGFRVVVSGKQIKVIEPADKPVDGGVRVIDCGGRTLMPGLIDAHWHAMMATLSVPALMTVDVGYLNLVCAAEAENTLMRGVTSVRDMAGPTFALRKAIDGGLTAGPRIWPSGAMISQTSGHGDFRWPYEIPSSSTSPPGRGDVLGIGAIADGPEEVLKRAREQLMLGASQLKLAAGGGVSSNYDPLDVAEFSEIEFHSAVTAAQNWGTYVAVHAYTSHSIQTAIKGGVICIEHGHLMDEATAKIMADQGIWLSTQPFLDDEDRQFFPEGSEGRAKWVQMTQGTDTVYGLARKYGIKTAWGTDILFDPARVKRQTAQLAKMVRWYKPVEALQMATGGNAQLLAMSGPRNPYPHKVGVVESGAYADLLLVDGDPITNFDLISDPGKNFVIIMKDGRIYKNTLA
jgi:imidazolonepropionase-like amidohydrolase